MSNVFYFNQFFWLLIKGNWKGGRRVLFPHILIVLHYYNKVMCRLLKIVKEIYFVDFFWLIDNSNRGRCSLMVRATDWELWDWGSIPGLGKIFDPWICLNESFTADDYLSQHWLLCRNLIRIISYTHLFTFIKFKLKLL